MDKETIIKYAPAAVVAIALLIQWNMFATPTDVERKHREILNEVADKYVAKEQYIDVKEQMRDIQLKVDRIYDKIIGAK